MNDTGIIGLSQGFEGRWRRSRDKCWAAFIICHLTRIDRGAVDLVSIVESAGDSGWEAADRDIVTRKVYVPWVC